MQDADRLDAIGAFGMTSVWFVRIFRAKPLIFFLSRAGILRCAAYSAAVNRYANIPTAKLRSNFSIISSRPLHAAADDAARDHTAVQHFYDKLLHIREQLKTTPGRAMATKRHKLVSVESASFHSHRQVDICIDGGLPGLHPRGI